MIRRAKCNDIHAMISLQQEVAEEHAIWGYGADSPEDWAHRSLAWTFVAMAGHQVVGFAYCTPRDHAGECVFPYGSKILEIVELVVTARSRGDGLGHELVGAVQRLARAEGFTHLRVYSAAKRFDEIVRFYRRCGFAPWYLEMTHQLGAEATSSLG